MKEYNKLDYFQLVFKQTFDYGEADITVQIANAPNRDGDIVAWTAYPNAVGNPGNSIIIEDDYENSYNASQMKLIMSHEIGHAIGLRHTNWYDNNESKTGSGAEHVPTTPNNEIGETDPNSIMNSHIAGNNWTGFTVNDEWAIRYNYPQYGLSNWVTAPFAETLYMAQYHGGGYGVAANIKIKCNSSVYNANKVSLDIFFDDGYGRGTLAWHCGTFTPDINNEILYNGFVPVYGKIRFRVSELDEDAISYYDFSESFYVRRAL